MNNSEASFVGWSNQSLSMNDLYCFVIALFPPLMIFNVPFLNIGLSTAMLLLLLPYSFFSIKFEKDNIAILVCCLLCFGYMVARTLEGSFITIVIYISVIIHLFGFHSGILDVIKIRKIVEKTSVVLTFLVLFQIIAYYIGNIKFTYLVEDLIIPDEQYMIPRFLTMNALFRPSATFLEPAHYAQYTCVGLLSTLFPYNSKDKVNIKQALWIALGCLLTRSGIGIILMSSILVSYVLFRNRYNGKNLIRIIGGLMGIVVLFSLLAQLQFVQDGLSRIFGDYTNGNAVWGRTVKYGEFIKPMAGLNQLIGFGGNSKPPNVYMTGFMEMVYNYGYLGFGLLIVYLLFCSLKQKNIFSFLMFLLYVGLMFAADVTRFVNVLFYTSFILQPSLKNSSDKYRVVCDR